MLITYHAIGLTPPVIPKLQLAIAGPRGVKPGHTAAYRITLDRTQPHYTVTNLHVVSTHALQYNMDTGWYTSSPPVSRAPCA